MTALRQEALQIVNAVPENLLVEFVSYLRKFQTKPNPNFTEKEFQTFLNSGEGINPKKAAAFARLEELRKSNTVHFPAGTDWKKEIEEAHNEKYFSAD